MAVDDLKEAANTLNVDSHRQDYFVKMWSFLETQDHIINNNNDMLHNRYIAQKAQFTPPLG